MEATCCSGFGLNCCHLKDLSPLKIACTVAINHYYMTVICNIYKCLAFIVSQACEDFSLPTFTSQRYSDRYKVSQPTVNMYNIYMSIVNDTSCFPMGLTANWLDN